MTILRRAAPTRWLYPAILLLLFMEKSSALEIAGYGGSASWTQIGFVDPYVETLIDVAMQEGSFQDQNRHCL